MEMTLRWYGSKFDTVTLEQIRQIPGVTGVITTLYDTAPGDVWSRERIQEMKAEVAAAGLHVAGIESVNVHDAIKTGSADRDINGKRIKPRSFFKRAFFRQNVFFFWNTNRKKTDQFIIIRNI